MKYHADKRSAYVCTSNLTHFITKKCLLIIINNSKVVNNDQQSDAYLSPFNLQRATARVDVSTIQCFLGPVSLLNRFKCINSQGMLTKLFTL